MVFECQQCGECCHHMGQVHIIKEIIGEYEFLISNQYTGEKTMVIVDEDKHRIFVNKNIFLKHPEACPFLRYREGETKAYCTVHITRPEICRDYGCWRLLILDASGSRAGRIMFQRTFFADDENLARLWKTAIDPIIEVDDALWDTRIRMILSCAGYTVLE
jgi:Fe-S-cluster containining protein